MVSKSITNSKGYTMVEIMASMLVFGIGLIGIMSMQIMATKGNRDSRKMTVAIQLAETMMEHLRMEALMWHESCSDLQPNPPPASPPYPCCEVPLLWARNTSYCQNNGDSTGWIDPILSDWNIEECSSCPSETAPAPRYDMWMNENTEASEYCIQYRLTTVVEDMLMRADVRILWFKEGIQMQAGWNTCPNGMLDGSDNPINANTKHVAISTILIRNDRPDD